MNQKLQRVRRLGFTLIELMVVVAIIGVLMAAGLFAFSGAQTAGRDARRLSDIDAVSKAMEKYNIDMGTYPAAANAIDTTAYFGTGRAPVDPKGGASYVVTTSAASYCVCATLEKGAGNATARNCTSFGTIATPPGFFCKTNQQ